MTTGEVTFGQTISKARKAKSLSQKDLAGIILKEEDGTPISPQYLNDIEHDRRSPTSDHLIRQFAKALDLKEDLLFVLAGKIPDDVRKRVRDTEKAAMAFMSFRTSVTKK
jgi:transcriptional regulator with XRE-family HTH domain